MLLTKLHIPAAGNNIVHRPELFVKLNTGLSRKLILISAPAGFGKTTLLSDWINQQKIPTAWFSLDKGDNDPADFLSYIISGIESIHKNFGETTLKLLKSANKPSSESIARLLINEILNIKKHFLLVLDDFHLITNSDIVELLSYLLQHIPDNLHIAILTRSDPALPLARLRSQHQLVELRLSELSFSANDISILFNKKLKLGLSIDDVYSLETKTEGWIAGLQLTALSLQGKEDISEFIQDLKGDNHYIMDYLIEEVLKIQTTDIKDFLLKTSLLEQISAPLCNAVLNRNDSQLILESLEKNNMFVIPLDSERRWYRYHHLFADLLKQRLLLENKTIIEELHNNACDWFEQNKMYELAIEHALETNNFEKSINILGEIVESLWEKGLHAAILKYGETLPDEWIKSNPSFCLYYSWILISSGKLQNAKPFLECAEKLTLANLKNKQLTANEIDYQKEILGKIFVAYAYLNSNEENIAKIFEYGSKALELIGDNNPLWLSWIWYSYGVGYYSNGDLEKSSKAFRKALDNGKKSGNLYLISTIGFRLLENEQLLGHYKSTYKVSLDLLAFMKEKGYSEVAKMDWTYTGLYSNMAGTNFIWANMDKALEYMKIAYDLSQSGSDLSMKITMLMVYSIILHEAGHLKESEKKMAEMEVFMKENYITPYITYSYIGWKIFIFIEMNQLEQAEKISIEHGLAYDKEITHANDIVYSAYARLLLMLGKLDEAEHLMSKLEAIAVAGKRIERLVEIRVLYAVLNKLKGNQQQAVACIIEAMEIAAEEEMILYFIFDLTHIKELLNEVYKIQATQNTKIPGEFIKKFKHAVEKREKRKIIMQEEELSARELETLRLIAEDLSNQEIADKLFISLNTVKTHLKNINLKLEADSRSRAVTKAKEMGLI